MTLVSKSFWKVVDNRRELVDSWHTMPELWQQTWGVRGRLVLLFVVLLFVVLLCEVVMGSLLFDPSKYDPSTYAPTCLKVD